MQPKDEVLVTNEVPTSASDNGTGYDVDPIVDTTTGRRIPCCICGGTAGTLISAEDNTGRYLHAVRTICTLYKRGDVPDNLHLPNRAERRAMKRHASD